MEALGCPQIKLTKCFGDSDDALFHAGMETPHTPTSQMGPGYCYFLIVQNSIVGNFVMCAL